MKSLLLLIPALLLTGCLETVPVKRTFPDVPPEIAKACPELQEATKDTKEFSKLLDVVVVNYSTYYECRIKIDAWLQWHQDQKKIFDEVK
jgi:hypothetical protein